VPKNQLNSDQIEKRYASDVLSLPVKRLFKSLNNLAISEKSFNISISRDNTNSKRVNIFDKSGK